MHSGAVLVSVLGEASEEELAVLVLAVLQALVVVGQERLGAPRPGQWSHGQSH
jgi:hypothetical protein